MVEQNIYWDLSKPFYKYVDFEHAERVANGSIRLGTLRGYASLVGSRSDDEENISNYHLPNRPYSPINDRDMFEKFGVPIVNYDVVFMSNCVSKVVGENRYCYCASSSDNCSDATGANQAIFEVADVKAWLDRLMEIFPHFGYIHWGSVKYGSRDSIADVNIAVQTSPFLKPLKFAGEREVRFIFDKVCANDAKPVDSEADLRLASLLKRIR